MLYTDLGTVSLDFETRGKSVFTLRYHLSRLHFHMYNALHHPGPFHITLGTLRPPRFAHFSW
jgi:hypothetical protein